MQELLREIHELKSQAKSTEALEQQVESLTTSLEMKTKDLEEAIKVGITGSFAVALIDGNGYIFQDDLLRKGTVGGEEAAQFLLDEISNHLQFHKGDDKGSVVARIFVNLDDLACKCQFLEIVSHTNLVRNFAVGFTRSQPLFDFVDVGPSKERASHKIRGMGNLHCSESMLSLSI